MNKTDFWNQLLSNIKKQTSLAIYNNWFSNTYVAKMDDKSIVIVCPTGNFQVINLKNNYTELIKDNIKDILGKDLEIKFITTEEYNELKEDQKENKVQNKNLNINSNLNPDLNFDNFIVGDSNAFAVSSAKLIAKRPGELYNPLFIYGNSGVGKTHLMHSIGNYIIKHSDKTVLYTTTEQFIADFVGMNKKNKDTGNNYNYINYFKNKYRNIDVLIIDDIQSLSKTKSTQEEFFNTFNFLHNGNKQIIISSDSSPNDLQKFEDHLKTRFSWGLPVQIDPPDYELRKNIIINLLNSKGIDLISTDVLEYIANNILGDVRGIQGAINVLFAKSIMLNQKIDLNLARVSLKDMIGKNNTESNEITHIQKVVANYFRISVDDLKSKKRSKNILFPRQIATYLCCFYTDKNYSEIAIEFRQTHSTVLNARNKIEKEMKKRDDVREVIEKLAEEIKHN